MSKKKSGIKTVEFKIDNMVCSSCEKIIEKIVKKINGVKSIKVDYVKSEGLVTFDKNKTTIHNIFNKISEKGYSCYSSNRDSKKSKTCGTKFNYKALTIGSAILVIILGAYLFLEKSVGFNLPGINENMSLFFIFIIGLLTGFHCIAMCGGFVISYSVKDAKDAKEARDAKDLKAKNKKHLNLIPHSLYGFGKTISYAVIGGIFGLIGSLIAFTPTLRGVVALLAGIFLIVFGLKMLNIFPILRKLQFKTPSFLNKFVSDETKKHSKSPLIIGLLNGLMIACGPLQAMYIYAAATGSFSQGALTLLVFGIGTLPVLLGFGILASIISNTLTKKILKAAAVVVIVLGIVMVNRGLSLTGSGYDINSLVTSVSADSMITGDSIKEIGKMKNGFQEIEMKVTRYGWNPDKFVLKKGVPVRWIIYGEQINGCNNAIQVPKLGLQFDIKPGKQVIEFTPTKEGLISWSCWMGMIPGVFIVKDDIDINNEEEVKKEINSVPYNYQTRRSCGGSCGSPTCGAARGGGCGCGAR